jgi:hypothetical protein
LAIFSKRIVSTREAYIVFAVCAFAVYNWSIFWFLKQLPGWLYYLEIWDILGIFAYSQGFALIESSIVLISLVLGAAIMPRLIREQFVSYGTVFVMLTAALLMLMQYNNNLATVSRLSLASWILVYFVALAVIVILLYRYRDLSRHVENFADRLTVLVYIYVPISVISLVFIAVRNI